MNAAPGRGAIGVVRMSDGSTIKRNGGVRTELAEWTQVAPGCWERRVREWGYVPPGDVRYGAAEVEKMNGEQREGLLEKLAFDGGVEAFFEGATDKEIEAYRKGVM